MERIQKEKPRKREEPEEVEELDAKDFDELKEKIDAEAKELTKKLGEVILYIETNVEGDWDG